MSLNAQDPTPTSLKSRQGDSPFSATQGVVSLFPERCVGGLRRPCGSLFCCRPSVCHQPPAASALPSLLLPSPALPAACQKHSMPSLRFKNSKVPRCTIAQNAVIRPTTTSKCACPQNMRDSGLDMLRHVALWRCVTHRRSAINYTFVAGIAIINLLNAFTSGEYPTSGSAQHAGRPQHPCQCAP